jgi:demethoxyubiquinone hydroxylase (CLK1/Coq7/Cat5 family)
MNNLATLTYDKGTKEAIEESIRSKYQKRIEYLVEANNELMRELERYEAIILEESWRRDMI